MHACAVMVHGIGRVGSRTHQEFGRSSAQGARAQYNHPARFVNACGPPIKKAGRSPLPVYIENRLTLVDRRHVAYRRTDEQLARTADLLLWIGNHFVPLRNQAN